MVYGECNCLVAAIWLHRAAISNLTAFTRARHRNPRRLLGSDNWLWLGSEGEVNAKIQYQNKLQSLQLEHTSKSVRR